MNEEIFQKIFDIIQEILPSGWKKIAFYAGFTEGSYSMKYYVDNGKDGYVECFKLNGIKSSDIIRAFMKINEIISPERNKLDTDKRWNILSMFIDSTGKMITDFDYTDISENSISYEEKWKLKNLK